MKLIGEQINIRELKLKDCRDIYLNANDIEISRFTSLPYPYTLNHAKDFINITKERKKSNWYELGIEYENKIVGMFCLKLKKTSANIGFWIGKDYRRKGLTFESCQLIIDYCKKIGIKKINAECLLNNFKSSLLLEKLNFKLKRETKDFKKYSLQINI